MSRFPPASRQEMRARGWRSLDVILVSGDAYIDSPFMGTAMIARVLEAEGLRVGVIAQPEDARDLARLGEPELFWGVSAGALDSLVANHTPTGRPRRRDDYTPGGRGGRRPDRAVIVYANWIRQVFKRTRPIVLGGIEAGLRRLAHYDLLQDRLRGSVLLDAKADLLLYGMAEESVVELARRLAAGTSPLDLAGLCYAAPSPPPGALVLPSLEECRASDRAFARMFAAFSRENDPVRGQVLAQAHGNRFVVQNPPPPPLETAALDRVHALPFTRDLHPRCAARGPVPALDTVRFAVPTHRGCYGECSFCAIAMHQGRRVTWRSPESIEAEVRKMTRHPEFRGIIPDLGGPTANMYGFECAHKAVKGTCARRRCLLPRPCPSLETDHGSLLRLMARLRQVPGVRRVFVASGLRHDLVLADRVHGRDYLQALAAHHISGQLKLAPEHSEARVLELMGKPGPGPLVDFIRLFRESCARGGKRLYLTYYLMAGHPGCTEAHMRALARFCDRHLGHRPRQVQIFTPTPCTWSTMMYHTGLDPEGRPLFVERGVRGRQRQKDLVLGRQGRGPRRGKTMRRNR